jgi:hypothetical protein
LSNKSIGMSSRTWTFFSCTLQWYWFKFLNGQQTLKHGYKFGICKSIPGIDLLILHHQRYQDTPFHHAKVAIEWIEWCLGWIPSYITFGLPKMDNCRRGPTLEDTLTPKYQFVQTFLPMKKKGKCIPKVASSSTTQWLQ